MSVWTRVQNKALYEGVDMNILEEALAEMNITLNYNVKEVENAYGSSKVDAALVNKDNEVTSLGIVRNEKGGISLVGDTWLSGIVGDRQANKLIDLISQSYQKIKIKKDLELQGWMVNTVKKEDKIVLECIQY